MMPPRPPLLTATEQRRRRRRAIAVQRRLRIGAGLLLLPVGLVAVPTPVPIGLVLFATGVYFVATGSRRARRLLKWLRRGVPPLSRWLNRIGPRMPRPLRLVILRSDPGV